MPRQLLVLDEVLAILGLVGISQTHIEAFRSRAEKVIDNKPRKEHDNVTVSSGFGQQSQQGFVELSIDDTLTQMEPKKAQQIALFLLEASEAAQSDEITMTFLKEKLGLVDSEKRGLILLELREIRQGTRGTSNPN